METSKNEVKNKKSFIVKPDLDDLEFMGGSYELNQSNINLLCCIFLMFHGDNPIHKCYLFYLHI
jgi:hypothetical protein